MAPTPSSGDSPASASGHGQRHEERIRRNVACISCRDSKVRCRANSVAGQPCQRCAKLQLPCVYDKSHKRVTKRSKLELLEQELKTIKEAVHPRNNAEKSWSPPTPLANNPMFPQQSTPNGTSLPPLLPPSTAMPELPQPPAPPAKFEKLGPTKSRLLGDRLLSGEDIDWYFNKFLQCFHPYVPVLRKRDPDECFQANPTLFWTVIYVASRRYARDEHTFNALVEQLSRDIWSLLATPNLDLEAVHAIMFICSWPFPTIRFVTDPSTTLISVAMNACMLMGLHDGLGSHPRFLVGGRLNFTSTDLEASITWVSCCILAQRIATYSGIPPPFLQHNDTQCKRVVEDTLSSEFMMLFELQKFSNKLHTAMAGQIAAHDGVFESMVKTWEDELETLKPFITRVDTDCSRFFILATQLEVQSYYFVNTPSSSPPSPLTILRTYTTAHNIITTALTLESTSKFLTHGPNWTYRLIVDAACILVSTLHSSAAPPNVTIDDANLIAQQAHTAVQYCSVKEGDLPYRGAVIMDTFWSVRNLLPKFDGMRKAWPQRIGAAVTFWCLNTFKDALQQAKKSTDGVNRGLEAFQAPANRTNMMQDQPIMGMQDPFQDVDWSSFLDDFGWAGDATVFLGPPQC